MRGFGRGHHWLVSVPGLGRGMKRGAMSLRQVSWQPMALTVLDGEHDLVRLMLVAGRAHMRLHEPPRPLP